MIPTGDREDRFACVVRRALLEDAAAIARIHVDTWQTAYRGLLPDAMLDELSVAEREERWRSWLLPPGAEDPLRIWLAERAGHPLGFAATGPSRDDDRDPARESEVYAIYVSPAAWGEGVGLRLMERALDELRAQHFASASLWVLEQNVRARRFYERCGFRFDIEQDKMLRGVPAREARYRLDLAQGP